jgi:hypothetical protein
MRTFLRTFGAIALVVAAALVPATAASAKPEPKAKVAKWASKHHLTGSWRAKDADRDGLKNLKEFKLGTNPRKADSDRDGLEDGDEVEVGDDPLDADTDGDHVKDGAEHGGVVTAVDGKTITIRQFKGGVLTATLADDAECSTADDGSTADDSTADDGNPDDGHVGGDSADSGWSNDTGDDGADAATVDDTEVDLGADDSSASATCDGVVKGAVLRSIEVERDGGGLLITAVELA